MPCCGVVNAPDLHVDTKSGPETLHKTLCQVCRAIVQNWANIADHDLSHEVVSGGITNLLYRVSTTVQKMEPKSALVRVFGDKTEIIIDRVKETDILRQLSDLGFSVLLYGSFGNGRIEGWKDMRPLQPSEMAQCVPRDICGAVAAELARMHELTPVELGNSDRHPQVFVHLDRFMKTVDVVNFDDDPARAKLFERINIAKARREVEWLKRVLPSEENNYGSKLLVGLTGPREDAARFALSCVFAHNDLLSGNILIDEANPPNIQFVDFEYACYNHRAYDIANHFTEYSGFDGDWGKNHPVDKDILHFLKEYLKQSGEGARLMAQYDEEGHCQFLEELLMWVSRFCCLSRVYWGYWAIIQARYSPIDFDFLDYSRCSFVGHYYYKGLYAHYFFPH